MDCPNLSNIIFSNKALKIWLYVVQYILIQKLYENLIVLSGFDDCVRCDNAIQEILHNQLSSYNRAYDY